MKATFFGGSAINQNTTIYEETIKIGKLLAKYGYTIHNGGYAGLMEAVSIGAGQSNGEVIGHLCSTFGNNSGNSFLTQTITHNNIYNRLEGLIQNSDLYIFQKGNVGTLSELFLVLDNIRKMKMINRPTIVLYGKWYENFNNLFGELGLIDSGILTNISDIWSLKTLLNKLNKNNNAHSHIYSFDSLDGHAQKAFKDIFNKDVKLIGSKFIITELNEQTWYFAFQVDDENTYLIKIENPSLGEKSNTYTLKQPYAFDIDMFNTKPETYFNRCKPLLTLDSPNTDFLNSFK